MHTDLPEMLPARMLNEYVYCGRLFHLEWVDKRWADNDDTEAGRFVHRATDRPGRALPGPDDADLPGRTTSVQLESERLGLVAVIDRLEQADGAVVPVDTKRGRPGPDGQPWPADRIQVLAQAALLRDAGYRVDGGEILTSGFRDSATTPLLADACIIAAQAAQIGELFPRSPSPGSIAAGCPPAETGVRAGFPGLQGRAPLRHPAVAAEQFAEEDRRAGFRAGSTVWPRKEQ